MRRSPLLVVTVLCPHFERPVSASRNATTERLVDCASKLECVREGADERGAVMLTYPVGCPVFRLPA